jgi:hypothetical protein
MASYTESLSNHFNLLTVVVLLCAENITEGFLFVLLQKQTLFTILSDSLKKWELYVQRDVNTVYLFIQKTLSIQQWNNMMLCFYE